MMDQTDTVADESPDFDPDQDIASYDRESLDADDLYDVRREAEEIDAIALAARIEIERRNCISYDDYRATFGQHELLDIGMALMEAKKNRQLQGDTERVQRISELAESFLDAFDFDDEDSVEHVDELPTVDEMTDE